jgi:hypothetical protein
MLIGKRVHDDWLELVSKPCSAGLQPCLEAALKGCATVLKPVLVTLGKSEG